MAAKGRPKVDRNPVIFENKDRWELICRAFENENESYCAEDDDARKIYLRDDGQLWALVDVEDYIFFSQWKWSWAATPRGRLYARRSIGGERNEIGRKASSSLYLHRAILQRYSKPPSPAHKIGDHRNGNSLDCRRINLRWATISMNNENVFGSEERERQLAYLARKQA